MDTQHMDNEHMDNEHMVRWEMPIDADSPQDAAAQARGILQDSHNIATVFAVDAPDGTTTVWDAQDPDNPHPYATSPMPPVTREVELLSDHLIEQATDIITEHHDLHIDDLTTCLHELARKATTRATDTQWLANHTGMCVSSFGHTRPEDDPDGPCVFCTLPTWEDNQ